MKKLLLVAIITVLLFPITAQENLWEMPVRKARPEQLEHLVRIAEMGAPNENEEAWIYSIVLDSEQVSSIVQNTTDNTSAIVISLSEKDYESNSDLAFSAGMAVERFMQIARRDPRLATQLLDSPADLTSALKEELDIPAENKAVAVVLVAERPQPPHRPDRRIGREEPRGFRGERGFGRGEHFFEDRNHRGEGRNENFRMPPSRKDRPM